MKQQRLLMLIVVMSIAAGCGGGGDSSSSASTASAFGISSSSSSVASSSSSSRASSSSSSSRSSVSSSSSQSSYSVTSITSNAGLPPDSGTTSIQSGTAATMLAPSSTLFNGLLPTLDTQVRFPKHALSGAAGTLPPALAAENKPYLPEVRVLARRDSIILYFANVTGAADYRAYAYSNTNGVSFIDSDKPSGHGKQPRGAVIACAGFRQHTYQSATVQAGTAGSVHTREVMQSVELPGFVTAGNYTIIVEATASPCPFVGMPGYTDAQITMQSGADVSKPNTNWFHAHDSVTYNYTGFPRAVIRSFDTVKQLYGNEIINGQGAAIDFRTRESAPTIGGVVGPNDPSFPSDPIVIARSAISVQMPFSDESVNAPVFDLNPGLNGVFDDFATDASVAASVMNQNPDYSNVNDHTINPLFTFNSAWQFWGRFMQAADETIGTHADSYWNLQNNALLGTQVFSRHGRLYTTFGDDGQDVGGTLAFASITAPVQRMDSTKFIHSMFRVNSEATHRRYWWWTMCGSANRADLFDDTTHTFKVRPTAFETTFQPGGNNPSIPDDHTLASTSVRADNPNAKECLTIEQRGTAVNPLDTSGVTRSGGTLRAMIHPAGYSHGARFLGNTLSSDATADDVPGFRYKIDAQGNNIGPVIEPFDQLAPLNHYDFFVRRDRLVAFVNGRQAFCVDLSDIPFTMNYAEIVYGDLIYHSSVEWQEMSNSATNKDAQSYQTLLNAPIASSRVWDVVGHADSLDIPTQFATYDPTACRKPSNVNILAYP